MGVIPYHNMSGNGYADVKAIAKRIGIKKMVAVNIEGTVFDWKTRVIRDDHTFGNERSGAKAPLRGIFLNLKINRNLWKNLLNLKIFS